MAGEVTKEVFFSPQFLDDPPANFTPSNITDLPICEYNNGPPVQSMMVNKLGDNTGPVAYRAVIQRAGDKSVLRPLPLQLDRDNYQAGVNTSDVDQKSWDMICATKSSVPSCFLNYSVTSTAVPQSVTVKACRSETPTAQGAYHVYFYEKNKILDNTCEQKLPSPRPTGLVLNSLDLMKLANGFHLDEKQYCVQKDTQKPDQYIFSIVPDMPTVTGLANWVDKNAALFSNAAGLAQGLRDVVKTEITNQKNSERQMDLGEKGFWTNIFIAIGSTILNVTLTLGITRYQLRMTVRMFEEQMALARDQIAMIKKQMEGDKGKPILEQGENLTAKARNGELDDVVGDKEEHDIDEARAALERQTNASAGFIGTQGDGKTATMKAMALRAARGDWGAEWQKARFISFEKATLMGDKAEYISVMDRRIKQLVDECIASYDKGEPIVLVLDEIHGYFTEKYLIAAMQQLKGAMATGAKIRMVVASTNTSTEYPAAKQADPAFFSRIKEIWRSPKNETDIIEILDYYANDKGQGIHKGKGEATSKGVQIGQDVMSAIVKLNQQIKGYHEVRACLTLMRELIQYKAGQGGGAITVADVYEGFDRKATIKLAASLDGISPEIKATHHQNIPKLERLVLMKAIAQNEISFFNWSQEAQSHLVNSLYDIWGSDPDIAYYFKYRQNGYDPSKGFQRFVAHALQQLKVQTAIGVLHGRFQEEMSEQAEFDQLKNQVDPIRTFLIDQFPQLSNQIYEQHLDAISKRVSSQWRETGQTGEMPADFVMRCAETYFRELHQVVAGVIGPDKPEDKEGPKGPEDVVKGPK